MPDYLSPTQASSYLYEKHNVRRAAVTLATMRCKGIGPTFRKLGAKVVYTAEDLDAWVASITSDLVATTREIKKTAP